MRLLSPRAIAWLLPVVMASATAQTAETLYASAQEALKRQDCRSAIDRLEKYKVLATEQLKTHAAFSAAIDGQIAECKRFLSARELANGTYKASGDTPAQPGDAVDVRGIQLK